MLFVVGTPIGNLQDLSKRQVDVLATSDIILTEDTRSAHLLLEHIKKNWNTPVHPEQRIISYYKEREFEKLPEIIHLLDEGKKIALISDAGMPTISDPGYLLIHTLIRQNYPFTVIPGPNAAVTALVASGFEPKHYMYLGFFPKKQNQIVQLIDQLITIKSLMKDMVFVAYESPERIVNVLHTLSEHYPDCEVAVCRELTKKFEEVVRGKPADLAQRTYKGEITLVIS